MQNKRPPATHWVLKYCSQFCGSQVYWLYMHAHTQLVENGSREVSRLNTAEDAQSPNLAPMKRKQYR